MSPGNTPAQATVEAKLASADYRVEDDGRRRALAPSAHRFARAYAVQLWAKRPAPP